MTVVAGNGPAPAAVCRIDGCGEAAPATVGVWRLCPEHRDEHRAKLSDAHLARGDGKPAAGRAAAEASTLRATVAELARAAGRLERAAGRARDAKRQAERERVAAEEDVRAFVQRLDAVRNAAVMLLRAGEADHADVEVPG